MAAATLRLLLQMWETHATSCNAGRCKKNKLVFVLVASSYSQPSRQVHVVVVLGGIVPFCYLKKVLLNKYISIFTF